MSESIDILKQLQALDAQLYRLRAARRQKPLALEQQQRAVANQQANAQAVEAKLKALQIQHKQKEMDLGTREGNVKKLQSQLFQVKTNKEYTAMQHEIEQCKADSSLLEEEIIALLDAVDQAGREHREQLAIVGKEQAALREQEARVNAELKTIDEDIAKLDQQRGALTPSVEPATLSIYERILANREGLALVPLLHDSCGGCHMLQRPQVIHEVHMKTKLVTCESCSRILYLANSDASVS